MKADNHQTTLEPGETLNLGEMSILHPPETFALTPASLIALRAIAENQRLLTGVGIDWGSGTGCLAILAARIPSVTQVIGLEISVNNLKIAHVNAKGNSVEDKVRFIRSDSFRPFSEAHRGALDGFRGRINFVLANPPSSEGDDGFGFRREVLRGAMKFLQTGGVVFLSISLQYGLERIERVAKEVPGFKYGGILASTDWAPFDLSRPDLLRCLEWYSEEEARGGPEYSFADHETPQSTLNARTAWERFKQTAQSPLSKWQTHLFTRIQ